MRPHASEACAWSLCIIVQLFCISSCLSITILPVTSKQLPNGPSCSPEFGICGVEIFSCDVGRAIVFRILSLDLL